MDLRGKVALVTGGAVRVGRAITLALADAGADIVLNYHTSEQAATETAAEVRGKGRDVLTFRADMAKSAQVHALMREAVAHFGRLDVLVNSASLWRRTPWSTLDEEAWDELIDVNLKGPFLCARAAAPHLAAHGDGAIVNIIDLAAYVPFLNFLPHSVAKAGLLNLTAALAMELAPAVRVNAVAPGPILPPPGLTPEQIDSFAHRTLLGRWGSPGDVGQAVVYLAQASYVTGATIYVDGGEHLVRRFAS
jgi:pteridine reductase